MRHCPPLPCRQDVTVKMDAQQAERAKQIAENDALRVKLGEVSAP